MHTHPKPHKKTHIATLARGYARSRPGLHTASQFPILFTCQRMTTERMRPFRKGYTMSFCVVGSLNIDFIFNVDQFPVPGETLQAKSYSTAFGGKGANQAVALARLGADVAMIGRVGKDAYGRSYRDHLAQEGINTTSVQDAEAGTGTAFIEVIPAGENRIVIAAGANGEVDPGLIDTSRGLIANCACCLLQCEIPQEATLHAAKVAKALGLTVILDPAPAANTPEGIAPYVDYVTPNESELETLSGIQGDTHAACSKLVDLGFSNVVVTSGREGANLFDGTAIRNYPTFTELKPVDTTAAGDTFNAAFAYALISGLDIGNALAFANAASSLAVTGYGAQSAMPSRAQVEALLARPR
jgi:ribokinase